MLHKLEMPVYQPQLEAILDFQQQLLAFACTAPSLPLTPAVFKATFGEQRGDWLSKRCWKGSKSNAFYTELERLIHHVAQNPQEGSAIVDAFRNDRDFHTHLDDPDFEFQYPRLTECAREAIAPLMVSFYERLLVTGFPDFIHLHSNGPFTRPLLLKGFYAANSMLKVCPGCDGQQPKLSNETRGIVAEEGDEDGDEEGDENYAEVDHFFPKASYPFFSVHFINLVPLCPICNIKAKKSKDPLNKCAGKGLLHHTFIPFIKPALPCIEVSFSSNANNMRRVKINDKQQIASQRVQNLNTTFALSSRWRDDIERWINDQILFGIREKSNRQRIEKEIRKILRSFANVPEEKLGQMSNLVIQRRYASYALQEQSELDLLIEQAMDNNAPKR